MKVKLSLIDVARDGEDEPDWRWHLELEGGGSCTFGYLDTAGDVMDFMKERGWEL